MGIREKVGALLGSREEVVPQARPGRNELCWCGSGKKYKKCHGPGDDKQKAMNLCAVNCGPA